MEGWMLFAVGFPVGIAVGIAVGIVITLIRPRLFGLRTMTREEVTVKPAIDPERLPDVITTKEESIQAEKEIRKDDPELADLARVIRGWNPKRHRDESAYHKSFCRHQLSQGYMDQEIEHNKVLRWSALDLDEGEAGEEEESLARPDFFIKRRVLVELKRELTVSGESDRALGQMLRYLVAWREKGPALLLICGEANENLKAYVTIYIRSWKGARVPIFAWFIRTAEGVVPGTEDEQSG